MLATWVRKVGIYIDTAAQLPQKPFVLSEVIHLPLPEDRYQLFSNLLVLESLPKATQFGRIR